LVAAIFVLVDVEGGPKTRCRLGPVVRPFVIGVLAHVPLGLVAQAGLLRASLTGAPVRGAQVRDRRFALWFKCSLAHLCVEAAWSLYGGVAVFGGYSPCSTPGVERPVGFTLLQASLIAGYALCLLWVLPYTCFFDTLGQRSAKRGGGGLCGESTSLLAPPVEHAPHFVQRWARYLQCLCVCHGVQPDNGGRDTNNHHGSTSDAGASVWTKLAFTFQDLFGGEDFVPGDILAGIRLVRSRQQKEQQNKPRPCLAKSTPLVSNDVSLFQDLQYFFRYSLGAYGWPLLLFQRGFCVGCVRLCTHTALCCSDKVHGDNACTCNTAALLAQVLQCCWVVGSLCFLSRTNFCTFGGRSRRPVPATYFS
jgi:hypothetical protein